MTTTGSEKEWQVEATTNDPLQYTRQHVLMWKLLHERVECAHHSKSLGKKQGLDL